MIDYSKQNLLSKQGDSQSGQIKQFSNSGKLNVMNDIDIQLKLVSKAEIEKHYLVECKEYQDQIDELKKIKLSNPTSQLIMLVAEDENAQLKIQQYVVEEELKKLQQDIKDVKDKCEELEQSNQTNETTYIEKYTNEISIWKQKYIQKNHELNQAKEKLMLSEAEFDSLSKEKNMMARKMEPGTRTTVVRSKFLTDL